MGEVVNFLEVRRKRLPYLMTRTGSVLHVLRPGGDRLTMCGIWNGTGSFRLPPTSAEPVCRKCQRTQLVLSIAS